MPGPLSVVVLAEGIDLGGPVGPAPLFSEAIHAHIGRDDGDVGGCVHGYILA